MPTIYWVSSPSRPDDTVMISGEGLSGVTTVMVARLDDGAATAEADVVVGNTSESSVPLPVPIASASYTQVKPLTVTSTSTNFVIPSNFALGVYSCYTLSGNTKSNAVLINAPTCAWFQAPRGGGNSAAPGEVIKLFGRCFGSLAASTEDEEGEPETPPGGFDPEAPVEEGEGDVDALDLSLSRSMILPRISTEKDIFLAAAEMDESLANENVPANEQQMNAAQSLLQRRQPRRLTGTPLAADEDRSLGGASASASVSGDLQLLEAQGAFFVLFLNTSTIFFVAFHA